MLGTIAVSLLLGSCVMPGTCLNPQDLQPRDRRARQALLLHLFYEMRRLGFTEVTQRTQGCAGNKWQGGDHNPDLLAPRTLICVAPNGLEISKAEQTVASSD